MRIVSAEVPTLCHEGRSVAEMPQVSSLVAGDGREFRTGSDQRCDQSMSSRRRTAALSPSPPQQALPHPEFPEKDQ